jgi:leucyl aminopeptidase
VVLLGDQPPADVAAGERHAEATLLARELTGTPVSTKTPVWVADRAVELAADTPDGVLTVDVRDEYRLAADGFGGLLAVGGGSVSPPRLVRLDLTPPGTAGRRPVVLIGKGVTYDTGGLSIKPREAMVPMKTDMAGRGGAGGAGGPRRRPGRQRAAALPAGGRAAPAAENAVGASSYRPATWSATTAAARSRS